MEGPQFLHLIRAFCQELELQVAANKFFDADHHFEPHKIGFYQQANEPKRGLAEIYI